MLVLDTDHVTVLEWGTSPERDRLVIRVRGQLRRRAKRLGELRRGREPVGRRLLEGPEDDALHDVGNRSPHAADRRRRVERMPRHERFGGAGERRRPEQHLVQHAS